MGISFYCPIHGQFVIERLPGESEMDYIIRVREMREAPCPRCGRVSRRCRVGHR